MSVFRYNSNHKAIVGILIVLLSALGFYLRDREKPKYDNGQAKQVGSQVDGRNHGMWIWYHSNGKKRIQGRFEKGKRDGVWITFDEKGDTLLKATYQLDKLNGRYIIYSANNQVTSEMNYEDDQLVSGSRN